MLCKPKIDNRFGEKVVKSRIGLSQECIFLEELINLSKDEIQKYNCIIVNEVQFATKEQIDFLSDIVDFLEVPVVCFGLRTDFRNELFPGSERLIAITDIIKEIKTVCWCGRKATALARYKENGIIHEGKQVVLGANDKSVSLCRKHHKEGKIKKEL